MRRLLAAALLATCALAPAASADPCEEGCHPNDCIAWEPVAQAPYAVETLLAGDPVYAVALLLPPPCPPA